MSKINLRENLIHTPSRDKWQRLGTKKRAGILAPLFCLFSKNSQGIGDLEDLKLLLDFAGKTGNSILQLLPMNEMGELFCPYDSLSSFALEPAYISLRALPAAKAEDIQAKIEEVKKTFPLPKVHLDYRVKNEKLRLLCEIYNRESPNNSEQFGKFKEEHTYWLLDFALFKALKGYHQGSPWYEWETRYRNRDKLELGIFLQTHQREIDFQMWMQWLLYQQFKAAKSYAEEKKVLLKGDLPILVSRDSADVWVHPEFFKLYFAAGAPVDAYCAKGQRWGMPTYNWKRISQDGYKYLKEKLRYAENFYDILRIDHVVGLFRIWSIPQQEPLENKGLHGFFDPQDEKKWEEHGRNILSVILKSTRLLLCAEDLGIIPKVCPKSLQDFGIAGNDVQRWVKDWKIRHNFLAPQEYRLLSVAMLSTHDTTNWPAWWENEAGTVDEELFRRKCAQSGIDYNRVKEKLFDLRRSRHGRLRWRKSISSTEKLLNFLGKKKEELAELVENYENTYQEKEKLWSQLGIKSPMREESNAKIMAVALKITLGSRAIFCIESIIDWLYLTNIFKGDPYQYRINTPGTVSDTNWSLVVPVALEDLLKHKVCKKIKEKIIASGR